MNTYSQRSPWSITLAVWKALFLREALARTGAKRGAWFWLLAEPVFHVSYLLYLYTVIRARTIGGIDVMLWITLGMLGFFLFRRTSTQTMNAVSANRSLFAYRQVKPIDTALVRAFLEGVEMTLVILLMLSGLALLGHSIIPTDPLLLMESLAGLWFLGLGLGLVTSVATEMFMEFGRFFNMAMMPLYMLSGVILPLTGIPQPYRDVLLYNPIAHGLELARLGFAGHYHAAEGVSLAYLYACSLVLVFAGLLLHRRFALKLVTQ